MIASSFALARRASAAIRMQDSYDEVPFGSSIHPACHPGTLAIVATLFGLRPPDVATCRVLEIGCAEGGNLIPIAAQLPRASLLGIDGSEVQVRAGRAAIEALGLGNVEIRSMDLREARPDLGRFDYILVHGVYSWVPREAQDAILRICRQNLAPDGIAYVSYNTYPGWFLKQMVREMMLHHTRRGSTAARKVEQARALVEFLARATPEDRAYGALLREAARARAKDSDAYLFHEFLEAHNEPLWFNQFVERIEAAGLAYLGEAQFGTMLTEQFEGEVKRTLEALGGDLVETGQYIDFIRGRTFRQSLLCHAGGPTTRKADPSRLENFRFAADLDRVEGDGDPSAATAATYTARSGVRISLDDAVGKAMVAALAARRPSALTHGELLPAVEQLLAAAGLDLAGERVRAGLADSLLLAFAQSAVSVLAYDDRVAPTLAERPRAFAPARYYASRAHARLPTARHELFRPDAVFQRMIPQLDGTSAVTDLVEAFLRDVTEGVLVLQPESGHLREDLGTLRRLTEAEIPRRLEHLHRQALLVEDGSGG